MGRTPDTPSASWNLTDPTTTKGTVSGLLTHTVPMQNPMHDVVDLQKQYFPDIHADTIWKRLRTYRLKAYVCHKKPLLTKAHTIRTEQGDFPYENWRKVSFFMFQGEYMMG
jgi:hypothetical protein